MFDDPPAPKPDRPLDLLSVDELEAKIEALRADIAACEAELDKKRAHMSAAEGLFGSSD
ncbi:MAG: DUF1192 domain-containing protein [Pseudomonadota bacterium]